MSAVAERPRTSVVSRRVPEDRRGERGRERSGRAAAAHLAATGPSDVPADASIVPSLRWAIGTTGLVLVVLAVLVLSRLAGDPARFPVTNVDVLGTLDYTDRDALRERIARELARGFHGLDIGVVRREVERLPWVASARVSRVWPGRVSIEIEEHEPAARWNDDALVSKRLALFRPPQLTLDDPRHAEWREVFAELPRLSGADGRHADVFEDYRRYAAELAPFGERLEALEEDARRSQTLALGSAVTVRLGYEDREHRLARFMDVHARLVAPLEGRETRFDMRYSNGFTVRGAGTTDGTGTVRGAGTTDGTGTVRDSEVMNGAGGITEIGTMAREPG